MARQITVKTIHGETIDYTMIKTVEEFEEVSKKRTIICEEANVKRLITEGEIILVNRMGGWCTWIKDYYTIINIKSTINE